MGCSVKVAIVAPCYSTCPPKKSGGTQLFISTLGNALHDAGIDVTVFGKSSENVKYKVHETSISKLDNLPWKWNSGYELQHIEESLQNVYFEDSFDIVHVNNPAGVRFPIQPLVCTVHHPYEEEFSLMYDGHKEYVHFVFPSANSQQSQVKPNWKNSIIYHGIDFNNYRIAEKKEDYYCFLGRLNRDKGVMTAIALALQYNLKLKIAGAFEDIETHGQVLRECHKNRSIEYVGELGMEDKVDFLGKSLGLLFPISWNEPFGLVMIEAMACGTLVFASPMGSVPEVVERYATGHIFGSSYLSVFDSAQDFQPAVVREHAKKRWDASVMADKYIKLYQSLI
jgi:glycosyltransferase involved in cell wall biosynthesis